MFHLLLFLAFISPLSIAADDPDPRGILFDVVELENGEAVVVLSYISSSPTHDFYRVEAENGRSRMEKFLKIKDEKPSKEASAPVKASPKTEEASKKNKSNGGTKIKPLDDKITAPSVERIRVERQNIPAGTRVTTPDKKEYTIVNYVDTGRRGVVYKVKDKAGNFFALKIAKDDFMATLDSLKDEVKKASGVKETGLRQAEIFEDGKRFVVKEWIEGVRGDEWFQKWVKDGEDPNDKQFKKILELFDKASEKGAYIGDLNPKNLVWDGKEWVILESGDTRTGLDPKEALKRYKEKFAERWGRKAECKKLYKILGVDKPKAKDGFKSHWDRDWMD